ncbi:MAG TPA: outer membrane protein assembly factor BamD [Tepidisphaeraceae bacterium]|nr:outer membrane protein assembly factor BamD [Tepidisphaeraceae bacterium]
MLRRTLLASILLLTTASTLAIAAPPPPAAEFRNGRWQSVQTPTSQPASDPELDRAEQLLKAGQNSVALKVLLYWIKTHAKDAPLRDRAVFLLGQANYQLDDRIKAFYFFDEVMDEYPESSLFFPALEMQYRIADEYLKGHKERFLGLPIVGYEEEAIEMLYRIQQRSPGSPLAERALLRTADWYYSNADYDLAHDAYGTYVKNYPRSPMVPQVKLRQAFSSLAQFRGVRFDPTPMLDARAELSDIMIAYPDLAKEENVAAVIHAIDETAAQKLFVRADFYQRTHEPRAAVYTYRYLLATYPNAPQAPKAKEALARQPQWALDQPEPPPGKEFAPPTSGGPVGGSQ